jgi:hypothetical protein
MDEDRQIRFLIPPFFLYACLLWWAYIDPPVRCYVAGILGGSLNELVPILAAAGAATIPIGYSIGTLGVFLLKVLFWVLSLVRPRELRQIHEACINKEAYASILLRTKSPNDPWNVKRPNLLYAVATFDHELLPEGIHKWLLRRFNSFCVAFNSALAIVIALLIVRFRARSFDVFCGFSEKQWQQQASWAWDSKKLWLVTSFSLLALLFWAAYNSWRETMKMIEFQAQRTNVDQLTEKAKGTARQPSGGESGPASPCAHDS